jgi:hypothetical protein
MADPIEISALPAAAALDGTELLPVVQGGVTSQTTTDDVVGLLPPLDTTDDIIPDVSSVVGLNLSDLIGQSSDLSVLLNQHGRFTSVRLATIAALPACTYSNGAFGVGATLTGDVNGALADIDVTTPALNDYILVRNQASALQNGIYKVTRLGDGSTTFQLTRAGVADTDADFLGGVTTLVMTGRTLENTIWSSQDTITIGTTSILWNGAARRETPGNSFLGANRNLRNYGEEMEEFEGPLTTVPAVYKIPGTALTIAQVGVGTQVTQAAGADAVPGSLQLEVLTNVAYNSVRVGTSVFTFSASVPYAMFARVKVPTDSDGTDTFVCRVGSAAPTAWLTGTTITGGIYFEAPADGSNWDAVTMVGSSPTTVDTNVAVGPGFQALAIIYDVITGYAYFYIQDALVASINTTMPTASLTSGAHIVKSAGSTSRSLHVDRLDFSHREGRTMTLVP